jgi:hypothetical protein
MTQSQSQENGGGGLHRKLAHSVEARKPFQIGILSKSTSVTPFDLATSNV